MANSFQLEETLDLEMQQNSTIRRGIFSFRWTIDNFREFMNRKYEFSSPQFSANLASVSSKWKLIIFPDNIYPKGTHVALRLVNFSEDMCYSVMYRISFSDVKGKCHELRTGEKVFKHYLDFDECPIVSIKEIKDKCLLQNDSLVLTCNLDLLVCENEDSTMGKSCGDSNDIMYNSNAKINIPSMLPLINDLSCSKPLKRVVDDEKNINALLHEGNLLKTGNIEIQSYSSNCKVNETLEMLSDDLKSLYLNKDQCDITIFVDDGKLCAHKVILNARSDYFKNIFKVQYGSEINIPNMNVATLDVILYYLYSGNLLQPISEYAAIDLLKECKRLDLPLLATLIQNFLKLHISVNNVIDIFRMSKKLEMDSLKHKALKFAYENQEALSHTNQWYQLMKDDPHSAGEMLLTVASFQSRLTK